MRIAVLTFEGFNELDSFVASAMLNRVKRPELQALIVCPARQVFLPERQVGIGLFGNALGPPPRLGTKLRIPRGKMGRLADVVVLT